MTRTSALLGLLLACTAAACSATTDEAAQADDSDLTSVTARSRTLTFVGTVYLDPDASDAAIARAVKAETQTAFGPLRTSNIAVNSRELKDVDPATFVKRTVKVVDPNDASDEGREMLEVKYTYEDDAVVGLEYARRTAAPLAVMSPGYASQTERILRECTANDAEAEEFRSSLWYVFEPRLSSCQDAIRKEQEAIDRDRDKLEDPVNEVAKSEAERLYLPIQAQLGADKTNQGRSYPEYQRLYSGGVKEDKLVVSLL